MGVYGGGDGVYMGVEMSVYPHIHHHLHPTPHIHPWWRWVLCGVEIG